MIVPDARRRLPGSPCGQRGVVPALVTAAVAVALLPAALATADAPRLPGIGADDWPWWRGPTHDGVAAAGAMRRHERSTGASGTVSGDGGRLSIAFPNDGAVVVSCLSRGGDVVWRHRLCDYLIHQGYGASPLVHGDTVIVVADHKRGGAVAALDRATGAVRWRRDRPPGGRPLRPGKAGSAMSRANTLRAPRPASAGFSLPV